MSSESSQGERDPTDGAQLRRRRRRRAFWLTLIALAALPTALQVEWWPHGGPRLAVALQRGGSGEAQAGAGAGAVRRLPSLHADAGDLAAKRCAYARWTPNLARPGLEQPAQLASRDDGASGDRPAAIADEPGLTLISNPDNAIIPTGIAGGDPADDTAGPPALTPVTAHRQPPPVVLPPNPTPPLDPNPLDPNGPNPLDPNPLDPGPPGPQDPLGPLDPGQPPVITPTNPILPLTPIVDPPGGGDPRDPGGPTLLPVDPRLPPGDDGPIRPLAPVPEPATWAMLILGFGAVGASLRRRRLSA